MVKVTIKITHDGSRFLVKSAEVGKELPRRLQSDIRDILKDESSKSYSLTGEDEEEYIKLDLKSLYQKKGEITLGTAEYNKIAEVYNVTVYRELLEEFGEKL